jgi:hypothetical protein
LSTTSVAGDDAFDDAFLCVPLVLVGVFKSSFAPRFDDVDDDDASRDDAPLLLVANIAMSLTSV